MEVICCNGILCCLFFALRKGLKLYFQGLYLLRFLCFSLFGPRDEIIAPRHITSSLKGLHLLQVFDKKETVLYRSLWWWIAILRCKVVFFFFFFFWIGNKTFIEKKLNITFMMVNTLNKKTNTKRLDAK